MIILRLWQTSINKKIDKVFKKCFSQFYLATFACFHILKKILIENNVETRMNDDFDHKTTIWIYISLKCISISLFCLSTGDEKDTAANASSEKQI